MFRRRLLAYGSSEFVNKEPMPFDIHQPLERPVNCRWNSFVPFQTFFFVVLRALAFAGIYGPPSASLRSFGQHGGLTTTQITYAVC